MGLLKKFFNQARRPEGFLGKVMLKVMNVGHAKGADWALSKLDLEAPSEILDIGCGGGRNAAEMLKKYPSAHVSALDYSPTSVKKTMEYNKDMIAAGRCSVLEGNVSALPFEDGRFDLVTAFETIYFWQGLADCFSEVRRVLKSGGLFLAANESAGADPVIHKFEKIIDGMKAYTPEEIEDALKTAGFSYVRTERRLSSQWVAVLAKK